MGSFKVEDYAPVQDRIAEFYRDFPDGCIKTYLRKMEGTEVVFEARVYRTPEDVARRVYTSGWAQETEGKSPVNKVSWVENCETSSCGRALANLGYTTDANRPSRSEMLKVARIQREHAEMLEEIRAFGADCPEDATFRVNGGEHNVKIYIRENWPGIKEQFRLARAVSDALDALKTTPSLTATP